SRPRQLCPSMMRTGAVAIFAIALVLSGCSSISPKPAQSAPSDNRPAKPGGDLRVALAAEPDALDPTLGRTLVGRTVFTSICEKLYDIDTNLTVVPQLAAELPQFSGDGLTATIKIRSGVKFADGTP